MSACAHECRRRCAGHARALASRQLFSAASPFSLFFFSGRSIPRVFASSALLPIALGPAAAHAPQQRHVVRRLHDAPGHRKGGGERTYRGGTVR